jgi:hypothetical protein
MRQTGSQLLLVENRANKTATQINSEDEISKCTLQRIIESFEDALDQALSYLCLWVGKKDSVSVEMYKAFGEVATDASMETVLKSVTLGILSGESALVEMQRRGLVSDHLTWDNEQEKISLQGPAMGLM